MRVLDRRPEFDERSRNYPIRALVPSSLKRGRSWPITPRLDQGNEGACVGFAWTHELAGLPAIYKGVTNDFAYSLYREAQRRDAWPGEDYEGTSIIAGARSVKAWGFMREYRWAFGIDDLMLALAHTGPAVLGTYWLNSMWNPRPSGLLEVSGGKVGGHAYLARGVLLKPRLPGEKNLGPVIRCVNSWGSDWGKQGEFYIRVEDLERLLRDDGEACVPVSRLKQ